LQKKLQKFADVFKVSLIQPHEPFSKVISAVGRPVGVDFVFNLSSGKSFESVRSRAIKVRLGQRMVWVAALEDIIAAKEAAAREKDKATLPILKNALQVKQAMQTEKNKNKTHKNRDEHGTS
ncbi:MAG: hypothetical protein GWN59_03200, partial [Calditrichae bacterium]|nr:hypothetical protein [Calditrichia bacterium]